MTSSACSTLTALDSPSRPPLLALPGTARMLSATVNGSIKHAAVADRKGGILIVCARASNVFGIGMLQGYMRVENATRQHNRTINDTNNTPDSRGNTLKAIAPSYSMAQQAGGYPFYTPISSKVDNQGDIDRHT